MSAKTSVLFVCLGNICRSPMAEAVFCHIIKENKLESQFLIGDEPDSRSVAKCNQHGVSVNHHGRQVSKEDFTKFDYIFCMDESNLKNLNAIKPSNSKATVSLFGVYDPEGERIIEDPYYGGDDQFERNFQLVTRCSKAFLSKLGHKL